MQIVINHLTRMQPGIFCVAGVDPQTGLHIRPVMGKPLEVSLLDRNGGPFGLARVIDLGKTSFAGKMPEIEDQLFDPAAVHVIENWNMVQLINFCLRHAKSRLADIFGPDLASVVVEQYGLSSAAVPEHQGLRSLGLLRAKEAHLRLIKTSLGFRLRMEFNDDQQRYSVAVTDIRLWESDHKTPNEAAIASYSQQLAAQSGHVLLSVGLSRLYQPRPNSKPQHWLQVNNLLMKGA